MQDVNMGPVIKQGTKTHPVSCCKSGCKTKAGSIATDVHHWTATLPSGKGSDNLHTPSIALSSSNPVYLAPPPGSFIAPPTFPSIFTPVSLHSFLFSAHVLYPCPMCLNFLLPHVQSWCWQLHTNMAMRVGFDHQEVTTGGLPMAARGKSLGLQTTSEGCRFSLM